MPDIDFTDKKFANSVGKSQSIFSQIFWHKSVYNTVSRAKKEKKIILHFETS